MGIGVVMLILGIVSIFGPWFLPTEMPMPARLALTVVGAILTIVGGLIIIIAKLYNKAPADRAFVKTGMGGTKVIIDGGMVIIPVIHTIIDVSLNTLKLRVNRKGTDSLLTRDKLRADIDAEFFIRVEPKPDSILQAARSLGQKSVNVTSVTELVFEKLVSALRTVAAKSTLEELNSDRDKFARDVADSVKGDLESNGFTLETVTVSSLDQTDISLLKDENIFDSEGLRRITQITSANKVEANTARREAERMIAEQDAATREKVAQQEFLQAQADAKRNADIAMASAEQERGAAVYAAEQDRLTREAQITKDQAVGQKAAEMDREVKLAQISAEQAAETAKVTKEQTVEVARRQQQIAIAKAEQDRAAAEAQKLLAEQAREKETQGVATVREVATADRAKQVNVIAAQQEAEVQKTERNTQADIEAYKVTRQAAAAKDAAMANAEAVTTEAEARRAAKVAEAAGQKAVALVPVEVKQREVEVDAQRQTQVEQARVDVLKQELNAKAANEEISVQLETMLRLLAAVETIGVAGAQAYGAGMSAANINVFGNEETLDKVSARFAQGLGVQSLLSGLTAGDNNPLAPILESMTGLLARKANGAEAPPAEVMPPADGEHKKG